MLMNFKCVYLICLGIGVIGLLFKKGACTTLVFSLVVAGILLLSLALTSHYVFLILLLSLVLLPLSVGIVIIVNRSFTFGENQQILKGSRDKILLKEFSRKLFHFPVLFLFFPISYFHGFFLSVNRLSFFIGKSLRIPETFNNLLLLSMGGAMIPLLLIENLRVRRYVRIHKGVLREKEETEVAGYAYLISTIFFLTLLFKILSLAESLLLAALSTAVIYDSFSAFLGRMVGRTHIRKGRSLEGTVGGGFVSFLFGLYFLSFSNALIVSLLLCSLDILHPPINDNFLFPFVVAFFLAF